jgi:hypothetical protein
MGVFRALVVGVKVVVERSVYIDREDARKVEEEERNLFLRGVLEQMGVSLDEIWPEIILTVEQKRKLRDILSQLELEIVDDRDRGFKIYSRNDLVAEWFKPRFILREDKSARSLSKKLYYEMIIKTESLYEGENSEQN